METGEAQILEPQANPENHSCSNLRPQKGEMDGVWSTTERSLLSACRIDLEEESVLPPALIYHPTEWERGLCEEDFALVGSSLRKAPCRVGTHWMGFPSQTTGAFGDSWISWV